MQKILHQTVGMGYLQGRISEMKKERVTKYSTIVLLLLLIFFSVWLYLDLTRSRNAGTEKKIGVLFDKKNYIYRKYNSEVVWERIAKEAVINNRDTIRSLDSSTAEIHLYDGTVLTLAKNSMIYLDFSDKNINIDFRSGSLKIKRAGKKTGGTNLNVQTKQDNTGISKDSEVTLSLENKRDLAIEVKKGKANFRSQGQSQEVGVQESLRTDDGKVSKSKLPFLLRVPLEKKIYLDSKQKISFQWERTSEIKENTLELAKDYYFRKVVSRNKTSKTSFLKNIPQGLYYWRVTGKGSGGKRKVSEVRKLSLVRVKPIRFYSPKQADVIYYTEQVPSVSFSWEKTSYPASYTLEVFSDSGLQKRVYRSDLFVERVAVSSLAAGKYYARLTTRPGVTEIQAQKSSILSFSLSKSNKLIPPKIMMSNRSFTYSKKKLSKGNSILSWSSEMNFKQYEVEIAKDKSFKNKLLSQKVSTNFVSVPKKIPKGKFHWRVRGVNSSSRKSNYASSQLNIVDKEKIKLLQPKNNKQFVSGNFETISFLWTRVSAKGKYSLEFSKDKFASVFKSYSTNRNSLGVKLPSGSYQYRVKLLDSSGSASLSDVKSFTIIDGENAPELRSPINNRVVNLTTLNYVDFYWKPISGAKGYQFRLIQTRKGRERQVLNLTTRQNRYRISNLRILDETSYRWEVKANYGKGRGLGASAKANFSISLDNPVGVPQIITPDEQLIK
ncbi:MAG: FecR domain-containing protein [Spirochaetota bacterium]